MTTAAGAIRAAIHNLSDQREGTRRRTPFSFASYSAGTPPRQRARTGRPVRALEEIAGLAPLERLIVPRDALRDLLRHLLRRGAARHHALEAALEQLRAGRRVVAEIDRHDVR